MLTTGVVITQNVTGLSAETAYHWRARLLYRPSNRPGQSASRWIHVPWNGWEETDFRTALPAMGDLVTTTVAYDYDPLYRLTSAAYSDTQAYTCTLR